MCSCLMFGSKCIVSSMKETGRYIYRDLKFSWGCGRSFSSSDMPRSVVGYVAPRYWKERGLLPSFSRMRYFCTLTMRMITLRPFEYDDTVPHIGLCYYLWVILRNDGCKVVMILTSWTRICYLESFKVSNFMMSQSMRAHTARKSKIHLFLEN